MHHGLSLLAARNHSPDPALFPPSAAPTLACRVLVVASALVPALSTRLGISPTSPPLAVLGTVSGADLVGCTYRHPFLPRESRVVVGGDYVTTESGTGLVHTAPGHGAEDYAVGMREGLPLLSPVDDAGRFTAECGDDSLVGLAVLTDGTAAVIALLAARGALVAEAPYGHKYPYDWRTKKPTIFRATEQWFASVERFRPAALAAIAAVDWVPESGERRITAMTESRSDWCISRQRAWGVPLPVFYRADDGQPLVTAETLDHVKSVFAAHGSDAWWELSVAELLPPGPLRDAAADFVKGSDTMDVWFDSGSSWASVLQSKPGMRFPADMYLEGSDQHRGWFQSSLLTAVAATGVAPYARVLTHGFVLDDKGVKMSKSVGNVVDPRVVIGGGPNAAEDPPYGADVLRLWVASVDYTSDVLIGKSILKQMADVYRKLRATLRFLLGNLAGYDPSAEAVVYESLPEVDRYMLWRLAEVESEAREACESAQFGRWFALMQRFAVVDLSAFYLDVAKDRLYIGAAGGHSRRSCRTVLAAVLDVSLAMLAPVLPHMAEDAYQAMAYGPAAAGGGALPRGSVFDAGWPTPPAAWGALSASEAARWGGLLLLRTEVNKALEAARVAKALGASLEARVVVAVESIESTPPGLVTWLAALAAPAAEGANGVDELRHLLIVSAAEVVATGAEVATPESGFRTQSLVEGLGHVTVTVARAGGGKCERCWHYSAAVGGSADHPTLCERCGPVVRVMWGGRGAPAVLAGVAS